MHLVNKSTNMFTIHGKERQQPGIDEIVHPHWVLPFIMSRIGVIPLPHNTVSQSQAIMIEAILAYG